VAGLLGLLLLLLVLVRVLQGAESCALAWVLELGLAQSCCHYPRLSSTRWTCD
jgi:hypothetical protein